MPRHTRHPRAHSYEPYYSILCRMYTAHFPGYHFCGPGTNFLKRTSLGQLGVNKLDEACRLHDMVYTNSVDLYLRTEADKQLEMQAWERVTAPDSSYKEKFAAWMVTNIMKLKRKWNTRRLRSERKKNSKKSYWFSRKSCFFHSINFSIIGRI
jgi:hypothetical protein